VLLAVVRDKACKQSGNLAQKIDDLLLKNRHQEDNEVYKILPTQVDRPAFCAIMDGTQPPKGEPLTGAYEFFERKLRLIPSCGDLLPSPAGIAEVSAGPDGKESRQLGMSPEVGLENLYNVVRNHLVLVSIVLDKDDNPYLIFESLNAKGRPLTQADVCAHEGN
jgi:hypothetical protein